MQKELIMAWQSAKSNLDHFKDVEKNLRVEICNGMFKDRTGKFWVKDTISIDYKETIELKAISVTSLKVDEAELMLLGESNNLSQQEIECFERKLHVNESKVRKLPSDSLVWGVITEKPGMPKLEVKIIDEN